MLKIIPFLLSICLVLALTAKDWGPDQKDACNACQTACANSHFSSRIDGCYCSGGYEDPCDNC